MNKAQKLLCLITIIFLVKLNPITAGIISEARLIGMPERFYNEYVKPLKNQKTIKDKFTESYYRGPYREIGKLQATYILQNEPNYKENKMKLFHALIKNDSLIWDSDAQKMEAKIIREKINVFFPEILDEIDGFAEVMGIDPDIALKIYTCYGIAGESGGNIFGGCTIFAISGAQTANGNILVGRSHELANTFFELAVVGVKPDGSYASAGCSQLNIGRIDGINDQGLFIGITSTFPKKKNRDGFLSPIIVRAILDKAKNVDEAIEILNKAPKTDGNNYLIADRFGNAVVVEAVPFKPLSVRWLKDDPSGFLVTTNHYMNDDTKNDNSSIMPNSFERIHIVKRLLAEISGKITEADISAILKTPRPNGVYSHDYENIFGTLFSGVYNLGDRTWNLSIGNHQTQITKADITKADKNSTETEIFFTGNKPTPLDYISFSPNGVIDINSFFLTGRFLFLTSPVMSPVAEISLNYKQTILGNEKTYGPNITYSATFALTPAFSKISAKAALNLIPLFSFEVSPFYYLGWRVYGVESSSKENTQAILDNFKSGKNESNISPGISINPIFQFGGLITFENKFTFYNFHEKVYEYESGLLLKKTVLWSPAISILIPYSKHFLWGVQAMGNYEFSDRKYNMFAGPLFVMPKLLGDMNLIINTSYWFKLSEGNDKIAIIIGLIGRI